ncbi:hypothetical protein HBA55_29490 [Pseudomaricurvus alkylphenolicus]|uniref:hypothetical protein n=1 Tax=Pseudomaricurvus alkylphenolicus TaxID=1306991 RepID=UPI0014216879|nr:hypothetical protein [Pseudomaricurvus alkylphenolicus]NIB43772.1 hypothetical protein [Pseudomaricurvus alkylphenolicus]
MNTLPQQAGGFSLTPANLQEAMELANLMANSEMVPKDYQGKPGNVLIAVQMGAELGLKPVQSLQNIAVVNGRPSVWGDGLRALIMSAPDLVGITDQLDEQSMTATCVISRKVNGKQVDFIGQFSQADAQNAGLWGRNTWKSYPKKMLEWRAFGFAARKAYADRLRGIQLGEEMQDVQEASPQPAVTKEMGPAEVVKPEHYPDADFEKNFHRWEQAIASGKKTAQDVINTVEQRAPLSQAQKDKILNIGAEAA